MNNSFEVNSLRATYIGVILTLLFSVPSCQPTQGTDEPQPESDAKAEENSSETVEKGQTAERQDKAVKFSAEFKLADDLGIGVLLVHGEVPETYSVSAQKQLVGEQLKFAVSNPAWMGKRNGFFTKSLPVEYDAGESRRYFGHKKKVTWRSPFFTDIRDLFKPIRIKVKGQVCSVSVCLPFEEEVEAGFWGIEKEPSSIPELVAAARKRFLKSVTHEDAVRQNGPSTPSGFPVDQGKHFRVVAGFQLASDLSKAKVYVAVLLEPDWRVVAMTGELQNGSGITASRPSWAKKIGQFISRSRPQKFGDGNTTILAHSEQAVWQAPVTGIIDIEDVPVSVSGLVFSQTKPAESFETKLSARFSGFEFVRGIRFEAPVTYPDSGTSLQGVLIGSEIQRIDGPKPPPPPPPPRGWEPCRVSGCVLGKIKCNIGGCVRGWVELSGESRRSKCNHCVNGYNKCTKCINGYVKRK